MFITRKEALDKGLGRYYTGKPCLRGHVTERCVSNRRCCQCSKEAIDKRTPDQLREKARRNSWKRNGIKPTRPRSDHCDLCGGPATSRALKCLS